MKVLIIAGYIQVPSNQRDEFVRAHQDLVERARRAPGCYDVAITADPSTDGRIYNYEQWESWDHVKAWRQIAHAPDLGIPIIENDVQAFEVADVRPPFD